MVAPRCFVRPTCGLLEPLYSLITIIASPLAFPLPNGRSIGTGTASAALFDCTPHHLSLFECCPAIHGSTPSAIALGNASLAVGFLDGSTVWVFNRGFLLSGAVRSGLHTREIPRILLTTRTRISIGRCMISGWITYDLPPLNTRCRLGRHFSQK